MLTAPAIPQRFAAVVAALVISGLSVVPTASAQSDTWDSLLLDSHWYVPSQYLLAYMASGTDLTQALPIADQTLWTITSASHGVFSGTSEATFKIGDIVTPPSTTIMNGVITDSGQVRIVFSGGSSPIIGIGQLRTISSETYFEMQMVTGESGDTTHVTHWAYMASYDGDPSVLPPLEIDPVSTSPEWAWLADTQWSITSPQLFGPGGTGHFAIDEYHNGYFWGSGTADTGDFTLIGSATPEGNILFNLLADGILTSLTGQITGGSTTGAMALRIYDSQGDFGDAASAHVVPEPSALLLVVLAAFIGILRRRSTACR